MKPVSKLVLIITSIAYLDFFLGFDARFTIINLIWCIPIFYDHIKDLKESDNS